VDERNGSFREMRKLSDLIQQKRKRTIYNRLDKLKKTFLFVNQQIFPKYFEKIVVFLLNERFFRTSY